ncbi:MAG: hypothetical protein PHH40_04215 [Candidatus Moranbacteria bacterium]|nr:hypothetical protein [Candidatus Moranbacteria bacterium]MDD3964558.1 hypothetical protein [Candidatus Moranbacteria bacterium]
MNIPQIPLQKILEYARFAPSGDNTQPWILQEKQTGLFALQSNHPKEAPLEAYYSKSGTPFALGTFLESIVISARHFGFDTEITSDPYVYEEHDVVAYLKFTKNERIIDSDEEAFFLALPKRHVNRFSFFRRPLDTQHKTILTRTVEEAGGSLHFIEGAENLEKMGKLWGFHDDFYWDHDVLRENFRSLVHSDKKANQLRRGIPLSTLGLGISQYFFPFALYVARFFRLIRRIIRSQSQKTALKLSCDSSAFGFIFLPKSPGKKIFEPGWEGFSYVEGGRIAQRLWLRATTLGLALQPTYTFVVMVSNEGNTELGEKFSTANRQMLHLFREIMPNIDQEMLVFAFRIGYPRVSDAPASPRKNVAEILLKKEAVSSN